MAIDSIIDQGVGGTSNIVGSFFSRSAAKKAEAAKQAAIAQIEEQNIGDINKTAEQYDTSSYLGRLGLLKQADPSAYDAYMGAGGLVSGAVNDANGQRANALNAANLAYSQTLAAAADPNLTRTQQTAAEQSAQLLAQGGALSPEMQAELVRAGLSASAGSGGVLGSTATRSGMARQLASDQLALQQQRQTMASNLAGLSTGIQSTRNAQLSGVGNQLIGLQNNELNVAGGANQFGISRMPSSFGLSGGDAADLSVQNTNTRNQKRLASANASVEGINAKLASTIQLIGGVGNSASAAGKAVAAAYTGGLSSMG